MQRKVTFWGTFFLRPILFYMLFFLISLSYGQDGKNELPESVKKGFITKYPEATINRFRFNEGTSLYKIQFKKKKEKYESFFSIDGSWVWTEREIKKRDLPENILRSFEKSDYASWRIDEIKERNTPGFGIVYEIELEKSDEEKYLYFTEGGELIQELDDDGYLIFSDLNQQDTSQLMVSIPPAFSQVPYFTFGQGLGIISGDSLFSMNIRFRIQNRLDANYGQGDRIAAQGRVRRLRLRFDGFVYSPKISYVLQLSFSREDMDWDRTQFPNIIRDAMIFYRFNDKLTLGLGQTKLPGNRQRVISSGDLQFVDRSVVNATLNIDRDFGIQARYRNRLSQRFNYVILGAISTGEGRNILMADSDFSYTGRIELLPFGLFERFGDYFEGDLLREERPKLSIGLTHNRNYNTLRTGGQIGEFLFQPRNISTYMSDWVFKYSGFSLSSEFLLRRSANPITNNDDGEIRFVYAGFGQNYQASYIFRNDVELAGRYSEMNPSYVIDAFEPMSKQYSIGLSKYLKGHRVKIQSDLTYAQYLMNQGESSQNWIWRFQVELGI